MRLWPEQGGEALMLLMFIELGIYRRLDYGDKSKMVFDVIVDGAVVKTCKRRGSALLELADQIDKKLGV